MKSINDLLDAIPLDFNCRNALAQRVKVKYKAKYVLKRYGNSKTKCICISDEDFQIILKKEKNRIKKDYKMEDNRFNKKEKTPYYRYKKYSLYHKITG